MQKLKIQEAKILRIIRKLMYLRADFNMNNINNIRKLIRQIISEDITIPINVGDVVLGGKFLNKKIIVKTIGKNKKGDFVINGKPLLRFRIIGKSKPLNENSASSSSNYCDSREATERRFNTAIYLTYVEQNKDKDFKKTTKEYFYDKLDDRAHRIRIIRFDKNRVYRLADEREEWLSKNNNVLGEIWRESNMESFWINKSL